MQWTLAVANAYFTRIDIPLTPVTVGVILCIMPRRCLHLRMEQVFAVGSIMASSKLTLASQMGGRWRRWWRVSRSHPKITLRVGPTAYPC